MYLSFVENIDVTVKYVYNKSFLWIRNFKSLLLLDTYNMCCERKGCIFFVCVYVYVYVCTPTFLTGLTLSQYLFSSYTCWAYVSAHVRTNQVAVYNLWLKASREECACVCTCVWMNYDQTDRHMEVSL